MKNIGGETELQMSHYNTYFTDSGRSSLRLILRSLNLEIVALPDYLCSVITDVFIQEKTEFIYYKVNSDFSINTSTILDKCDAVYIIDYFGIKHDYLKEIPIVRDKIIIEDNVFSPYIENTSDFKKWLSFNSYRKISACAEGSLIRSNIELRSDLIASSPASFIKYKYQAKATKFEYLNNNLYSEDIYLTQFEEGEELLDRQRVVFSVSDDGMSQIISFHESLSAEMIQRDKNFSILENKISPVGFETSMFKSFFVFSCENLQNLRTELMTNKIYLPRHWPNSHHIDNYLYQNLLSIPVDCRYDESDMERIAQIVCKYLL